MLNPHRFAFAAGVATLAVALVPRPALAQDTPAAPSNADAACVAIVMPSVDGVEDSTAVAASVRSLFQSYLTGPSLRSIALDAKLVSQATQEAKQKQCPRLLTVSLSRKAGSSGGHKLGAISQAAGTAASYIPYAGAAGG